MGSKFSVQLKTKAVADKGYQVHVTIIQQRGRCYTPLQTMAIEPYFEDEGQAMQSARRVIAAFLERQYPESEVQFSDRRAAQPA